MKVWGLLIFISFFLNIPWKWNNLVSLRPTYFTFIGYFKRGGSDGVRANPLKPFWIRLWTHKVPLEILNQQGYLKKIADVRHGCIVQYIRRCFSRECKLSSLQFMNLFDHTNNRQSVYYVDLKCIRLFMSVTTNIHVGHRCDRKTNSGRCSRQNCVIVLFKIKYNK